MNKNKEPEVDNNDMYCHYSGLPSVKSYSIKESELPNKDKGNYNNKVKINK
jgi:hypothetical protein